MKILVVGGTLYFGKIIVRSFLERGDEVTIYSRGNTRPEFWDECDHIIGDRTDQDSFRSNLAGRSFDAVIDNLAFRVEDVQSAVRTLKGNTGRYIVASTVSIYGGPGHALTRRPSGHDGPPPDHSDQFVDLVAECPITEDSVDLASVPWTYDDTEDEYAQGKRQIERYLAETSDFPWVVMRVPATMGPEDPSLRFWWYQQRIEDGRPIVLRDGGSGVFRLGFRDDIARAFVDAADSPDTAGNIYNICQTEIPTLRHYLETVAGACGTELNAVSVPGRACDLLSDLPWKDWSYDPLYIPSPYVMSVERARRDFAMFSTPMADWISETVNWYRENRAPDSAHYEGRDREVELAERWDKDYSHIVGA
ncbi:MAG: NAD-dependent epimerase/dehydratase family protein [Dehalococcoidia bacterium]|nr:NAD-dependent epimerase/dehydratase family protein [Dehalococcoidia bacterium]